MPVMHMHMHWDLDVQSINFTLPDHFARSLRKVESMRNFNETATFA